MLQGEALSSSCMLHTHTHTHTVKGEQHTLELIRHVGGTKVHESNFQFPWTPDYDTSCTMRASGGVNHVLLRTGNLIIII